MGCKDINFWKSNLVYYLSHKPETVGVRDVSRLSSLDDVELIWTRDIEKCNLRGYDVCHSIDSIGVVFDDKQGKDAELFFEMLVHKEPLRSGWFYGNHDFLAYVAMNSEKIYLMKFDPVRSWVLERCGSFPRKFVRHTDSTGAGYHSVGILVPQNTLIKHLNSYVEIFEPS